MNSRPEIRAAIFFLKKPDCARVLFEKWKNKGLKIHSNCLFGNQFKTTKHTIHTLNFSLFQHSTTMRFNIFPTALALAATLLFSLSATAQWTSNATSVFLSNANKNVGIGTSTPHAPLQLANLPLQNRKIVLFEDANNEHSFFGFGINPAAMRYQVGNNSSHVFYASNSAGTASAELLRIKSSGEVGIGTASPNSRLHINGTESDGTTGTLKITSGTQNMVLDGNEIDVADNKGLHLQNNSTGNLALVTGGGSVGVGTETPTAKLHIIGTGIDNDGITAVVRIVSGNGAQNLLLDGNEIDALADGLYLNNNTNQNIVLVNGGGKVGIGTTDLSSSYKLRVNGSAFATGIWIGSDQRYKDNIQTLGNALQKVLALRGTEYTFRTQEFKDMNFDAGKQIGFIAQEMKQVLPELVMEDATGYHAVNYQGLVPVLVEAIKEQHAVIAEKETRIAALEDRLARIEAALGLAADRQPVVEKTAAVTATVSPNPTSGLVTVRLSNTASAKSITVRILDSAGREVASRSAVGEGSIQFDLSQFPVGMYVAQVVADGKVLSADKVQLVR